MKTIIKDDPWILIYIFAIILSVALTSCSQDEILIVGKKTSYNFRVESTTKTNPFSAKIVWSDPGHNISDTVVKTWGYTSEFDLREGQEFTLTATSTDNLVIQVYIGDNEIERHSLTSDNSYTFSR
jgi:hypothetical protein